MTRVLWAAMAIALVAITLGCDDDEPEADRLGVGAECAGDEDCAEAGQVCLRQFKGGYCGVDGCQNHDDCPAGSACVAHDNGEDYCFRVCTAKADCNRNRSAENESNCSANVVFLGEDRGKACVPPSGG